MINQPPALKSHFVLFSNYLYFQMVSLFYTQVETSWTPESITADHWFFFKKTIPQMIEF